MLAIASEAQSRAPKSVAIFLYQGVELLDFAGPGEVFSAAGFKVFTVSVDGKELKSAGIPDHPASILHRKFTRTRYHRLPGWQHSSVGE